MRGWCYFSKKELEENSPSRRDGISLKHETYLRKSYCTFLRKLGIKLQVSQFTIAAATILCHRFFLIQSHSKNDRMTIATVCMFLAGKSQETPRSLRDVVIISYELIHNKDKTAAQRIKQRELYQQQKEIILLGERLLLVTLGFDLKVDTPYIPLVKLLKKFEVKDAAFVQAAWSFVNDGLWTLLCLQFDPHQIAVVAFYLAAEHLKVKVPSNGEKLWWQEHGVSRHQLEEISCQILELYKQLKEVATVVPSVERSEITESGPSVMSSSSLDKGNTID